MATYLVANRLSVACYYLLSSLVYVSPTCHVCVTDCDTDILVDVSIPQTPMTTRSQDRCQLDLALPSGTGLSPVRAGPLPAQRPLQDVSNYSRFCFANFPVVLGYRFLVQRVLLYVSLMWILEI